jgi:hypothetical protein
MPTEREKQAEKERVTKISGFRVGYHLTFRTLFRPSDAIFEEPRVESGAGAIYRPFYAL